MKKSKKQMVNHRWICLQMAFNVLPQIPPGNEVNPFQLAEDLFDYMNQPKKRRELMRKPGYKYPSNPFAGVMISGGSKEEEGTTGAYA